MRTLVDTQQIASLPLKTRDFLDLTLLAPGVVADQGSASGGQTDSISFGGMSENYKSIWLEGVDFNDEVTGGGSALSSATRIALAQEAIQEFQVMANSYTAEFGRSASGAINILTKSGGNELHGSGFYFLPRRRLRPAELLRGDGAAVQDRAVRRHRRRPDRAEPALLLRLVGEARQRALGAGQHPGVSIRDYVQLARLRHARRRAGHHQRAQPVRQGDLPRSARTTRCNATYMYDHRDLTNQQTGGNSAGDHGYDDKRRAWFLVGNLTSVLRSNLVNELRLSASHQALDRVLPAGSTSRPEIRFPTVQFGRASNVPQGRSQDNYIVTNATSLNFVAKGTHDLKFGFEANIVPTTSTINQSFNGLFEFLQDRPVVAGDPTSLPFRFTQGVELRGELAALTRDVNIYSAFVNNQWRPVEQPDHQPRRCATTGSCGAAT